jgi:serine/threonine protein kinase
VSVLRLDTELERFARELGNQYDSDAEGSSVSVDVITQSVWDQCAARTGLLGDATRLKSVHEFLNEANQQPFDARLDLDFLTRAGTVMGTPSYMAPEQATGDLTQIGPRTDVYALGGILYELLTGQPPIISERLRETLTQAYSRLPIPPRQLVPDVSRDIEAVCLKCLEKAPDCRYQNAASLAEDLSRFLDGYAPRAVASKHDAGQASPDTAQTNQDVATGTKSWWPFGRSRSKTRE